MPAFAAMTINDSAAVAKTFNPVKIENNVAIHQDQSGGVPILFPTIGLSLKMPTPAKNGEVSSANTRVCRSIMTVDLPTGETLGTSGSGYTPPPTVAYVNRAKLEVISPERSTLTNRKDVRAFVYNALNLSYTKNVFEDLQAIY